VLEPRINTAKDASGGFREVRENGMGSRWQSVPRSWRRAAGMPESNSLPGQSPAGESRTVGRYESHRSQPQFVQAACVERRADGGSGSVWYLVVIRDESMDRKRRRTLARKRRESRAGKRDQPIVLSANDR